MKRKMFSLLSICLLMFTLAACSDKEESKEPAKGSTSENVSKETPKEEAVAATGNVVEVTVKMSNFEYDVKEIKAKAGDTIKVTVENGVGAHGFAIDEFGVDLKGGESTEFVVDKAGEYDYYCSLMCGAGHDNMVGKLIVE